MAEALDPSALANLLAMVGDDPEFVDELANAFLADVPAQRDALRNAMARSDAAALVRPAHTLKGASLSFGALRVADLARQVEERGRAGSLEGVPDLVSGMDAALDELAGELDAARSRRWRPA